MPAMHTITVTPGSLPPPDLLASLAAHLPHSLPVLRRLQFAARLPAGGSRPSARAVWVSGPDTDHFAAAYFDPAPAGAETECWAYSSLEAAVPPNPDPTSSTCLWPDLPGGREEVEVCVGQVLALFGQVKALQRAYAASVGGADGGDGGDGGRPASVLVGALHETVRQCLVSAGVGIRATAVVPVGKQWEFYATWLVRLEDVAGAAAGSERGLGEGMRWDTVRREDAALIKSRTSIPKSEDTLVILPSTVIRLEDGTPIAWVFLGLDGSVSTLHVEEPYRGRGLAKTIARRLLRDHLSDFGDDGWASTDISTTNLQSQGVFRSIGGKPAWTVSWFYLDLSTIADPIETDTNF